MVYGRQDLQVVDCDFVLLMAVIGVWTTIFVLAATVEVLEDLLSDFFLVPTPALPFLEVCFVALFLEGALLGVVKGSAFIGVHGRSLHVVAARNSLNIRAKSDGSSLDAYGDTHIRGMTW